MSDYPPHVVDVHDPEEVHTDRYWRVVNRTVRDVFDGNLAEVEKVRARLAGQSKGTQEKFYQTEPYTVAADIAGKPGAGTPQQQLDYLRIRKDEDFGPVDIRPDVIKAAGG